MVKMRATSNKHDHQKTTGEIDTVAKGGDPTITTTMAPIAKQPWDTKTIIIKEMTAETQDTAATEEKTMEIAKGFSQGNLENITHHQMTC
jgi:hypothetical protein